MLSISTQKEMPLSSLDEAYCSYPVSLLIELTSDGRSVRRATGEGGGG
jgi:hypothetical protein